MTMNAKIAADHVQTIPGFILAAVARGEIDLNALASQELASRGLNHDAKWVGFARANAIAEGK